MTQLLAYFGVCGIGLGHATRSIAVAKALKSRGWNVGISTYGEAVRYSQLLGFNAMTVPRVGYGAFSEGKVSVKLTIFKNAMLPLTVLRQVAHEVAFLDKLKPDVVISDTRASTVIAADLLGYPLATILNMFNFVFNVKEHQTLSEMVEASTDLIPRIWARSDTILVADFPPPHTISRGNLRIPPRHRSKTVFVGPLLEKLSSDLPSQEAIKRKHGIKPSEPTVLVHVSGPSIERRAFAREMMKLLTRLPQKYRIVVTLGIPGDRTLKRSGNILTYGWVEDTFEFVKMADAVIARGGHSTIMKSLSLGKPLMCIPTTGQSEQEGNASRIQEIGAGIRLQQEGMSAEKIQWALQQILTDNRYVSAAEEYRKLAEKLDPIQKVVETISWLSRAS